MDIGKISPLHQLFYLAFFVTLVISGYIFVVVLFFGNRGAAGAGEFSSWQFPMLLALFVDAMGGVLFHKHLL